jgi:hypothetical protein
MAEKYHEDLLEHLSVEQARINSAINTVHEINNNGNKYKAADKASLIASVIEVCGSSGVGYVGNARPEPEPDPDRPAL